MAQDSRPCKGCGATIYRTAPVAPIRHYCSPDCRPRCAVDGCEKPRHGLTYCSAHHTRWKRFGDPLAPRVRRPNGPRVRRNVIPAPCSIEGCARPSRKSGWCEGHYQQWYKYGEARPFFFTWADEPNCLVCGQPNGAFRSRKFCSSSCAVYYSRWAGALPPNPHCVRCGTEIDLRRISPKGYRQRADAKQCRKCRAMRSGWMSPGELAARDGAFCGICGCDVDLAARHPDSMRGSTDHVIPRARGGSDDPENQQLAHLICNQVKSDRVEAV